MAELTTVATDTKTMTEIVAERCLNWMQDVIEVHMDMTYGEPEGYHLEAIEDSAFIIECIKMRMEKYYGGTDECDN